MTRWLLVALLLIPVLARAEAPQVVHDLRVDLDPETGAFAAQDTITVTGPGPVTLWLNPGLEVDRATLDGQPFPPVRANEWHLDLDDTRPRVVELTYGARLAAGGDRRAAVVDPGGSYLPPDSGWFPISDGPMAYDITVRLPEGQQAVLPGALAGPNRFVHQGALEPPPLIAGPYVMAARQAGPVTVRTWFPAELADHADAYLDRAATLIGEYGRQIGPYPYADFHIVAAPLPVGLAFEGLTYVSSRIIPRSFMLNRSLAHEILHAWWGGGVAIDARRGNWAEGLTTYMADHAAAEAEGAAEARRMRIDWLRNFAALSEDRPLTSFRSRHNDAAMIAGYDKAAFVFHMLRGRLGAAGWADMLRRFWADHQGGAASWDDLRAAAEAAGGDDLTAFFDQWLERAGAPELARPQAVAWPEGPGWHLRLTLSQAPPAYDLRVPVRIVTETGTETRSLPLTEPQATFDLTLDARPVTVTLDPGADLFRRLAPGEAPPILRDITLAPSPRVTLAAPPAAAEALLAGLGLAPDGTGPATVHVAVGRSNGPAPPADLAGRGSARVWTGQENGHPFLAIQADDPQALAALARPLPHYRRRSWLVFAGSKVIDQGTWPFSPALTTKVQYRDSGPEKAR